VASPGPSLAWRRAGALNGHKALLPHAEANHAACCVAFGPSGSLKGSRTFFANGGDKRFAIVACDSISRPLDITQSTCLPRLTLRARWSRRTGWARFASGALWACRSLLSGTSLWTSWARRSRRTLRTGWPLRAGGALRTGGSCRALGALASDQQDCDRKCDNGAQSTHVGAPKYTFRRLRNSRRRRVSFTNQWWPPTMLLACACGIALALPSAPIKVFLGARARSSEANLACFRMGKSG
jgi:hypothetical protein